MAAAYAQAQRRKGSGIRTIARELGVPKGTLKRWLRAEPTSVEPTELLPVRLVDREPLTRRPWAPAASPVVTSPTGWRIEGLSLEDAVALLRATS